MNNKKRTTGKNIPKRGFTLVEVLVSISILVVAITAPLVFVSASVSYGRTAKYETTATYLAQEAIEALRNERDRATLNGGGWGGFLSALGSPSASCFSASGCLVDVAAQLESPAAAPLISACSGACSILYKNSITNLYSYRSSPPWAPTTFTRTVKVVSIDANELKITSIVSWATTTGTSQTTLTEFLRNWQ